MLLWKASLSLALLAGSAAAGTVGKGATGKERQERNLLPAGRIAPGTQLFFVGKCPCCGDKYLSNAKAAQCGSSSYHEKMNFGKMLLTLEKKIVSANGERYGDKKKSTDAPPPASH